MDAASNDEDKGSQDKNDNHDDYDGKSGIYFLIDFREAMFYKKENSFNDFRKSLEACKHLMVELAKLGRSDFVGLSLFGSKNGNVDVFPMMVEVLGLDSLSTGRVTTLDRMLIDNCETAIEKYGQENSSTPLDISRVLRYSRKQFNECKKKLYNRSVLLFTNDDDPCKDDDDMAHFTRKEGRKLWWCDIELSVVGVSDLFAHNKFYNELLFIAQGDESYEDWGEISRVKTIRDITDEYKGIMTRWTRMFRNLVLDEGWSIPVTLYSLFKRPKLRIHKKALKDDSGSQVLQSEESLGLQQLPHSSKDNNKPREEDKEIMLVTISGETINLSLENLKNALFRPGVGLKLMGFFPSKNISEHLTMNSPKVMLPNSHSKVGTDMFANLLEVCQEREMSMICWYMYNKNTLPVLVACHPMTEQSDQKGRLCPPGFCVVRLPFLDNYSDPEPLALRLSPSETQIDAASQIIKKMTSTYSPGMFHDFEYHKYVTLLEALALEYDTVPVVVDDTVVDEDEIAEILGDLSEKFTDCSHIPVEKRGKNDLSIVDQRGPQKKDMKRKEASVSNQIPMKNIKLKESSDT